MPSKYILRDGDVERFWSKVDRSGGPDACWLWTAKSSHRFGYGKFYLSSLDNVVHAHRFAYFPAHGEIPDGMFVCHDCPDGDNPRCVNPAHMFLGTNLDNMRDREAKGRHPHTPTWAGVGSANPNAKMTEEQVIEARRNYADGGLTQTQLAQRFGISPQMMNKIILSRHWTHLPSVDDLRREVS